jgi:hypothetical protein
LASRPATEIVFRWTGVAVAARLASAAAQGVAAAFPIRPRAAPQVAPARATRLRFAWIIAVMGLASLRLMGSRGPLTVRRQAKPAARSRLAPGRGRSRTSSAFAAACGAARARSVSAAPRASSVEARSACRRVPSVPEPAGVDRSPEVGVMGRTAASCNVRHPTRDRSGGDDPHEAWAHLTTRRFAHPRRERVVGGSGPA